MVSINIKGKTVEKMVKAGIDYNRWAAWINDAVEETVDNLLEKKEGKE